MHFSIKRLDELHETGFSSTSATKQRLLQETLEKEQTASRKKLGRKGGALTTKKEKGQSEQKKDDQEEVEDNLEKNHETIVMHNPSSIKKVKKIEEDKEDGGGKDLLRKLKFNKGVSIREEGEEGGREQKELDIDTTMEQMKAGKSGLRLTRHEYDQLILRGRHFTHSNSKSHNMSMGLQRQAITPNQSQLNHTDILPLEVYKEEEEEEVEVSQILQSQENTFANYPKEYRHRKVTRADSNHINVSNPKALMQLIADSRHNQHKQSQKTPQNLTISQINPNQNPNDSFHLSIIKNDKWGNSDDKKNGFQQSDVNFQLPKIRHRANSLGFRDIKKIRNAKIQQQILA